MKPLTQYLQNSFRFDLIAGFTVAMIAVPQAMAYAAIAGVNPIYGLYTAILPAIIAALFGSSRHLNTGPTNGIALVTIGVLLPVVNRIDYAEYVFAIAILSGAMRFLLGVLQLGGIIRFQFCPHRLSGGCEYSHHHHQSTGQPAWLATQREPRTTGHRV